MELNIECNKCGDALEVVLRDFSQTRKEALVFCVTPCESCLESERNDIIQEKVKRNE